MDAFFSTADRKPTRIAIVIDIEAVFRRQPFAMSCTTILLPEDSITKRFTPLPSRLSTVAVVFLVLMVVEKIQIEELRMTRRSESPNKSGTDEEQKGRMDR